MKTTTSENTATVQIRATSIFSDLTEKDFAWLARSYITPDLARRAQIYRVDSQEGARIVGRKATARADYAGLIFPYIWPGESRAREYRLRRDNPDLKRKLDGTTKEDGKYLSPTTGRNILYFPPDTPCKHLTDASVCAVITEGEKKALALSRYFGECGEDRLITGLSGAWNWRGAVGKELNGKGQRQDVKGVIPDFDRIQWNGREVWIVFDANAETDDSVAAARRELAKELTRRGAMVHTLNLPGDVEGVNGIDDLLFNVGADYVAKLFASQTNATTRKSAKRTIGSFVFTADDKGVWAIEVGSPNRMKVCAPLYIEADTRNARGECWGRLLIFRDREEREKGWVMPHSLLAGDKSRYREKLLDMGLAISPGRDAENLLHLYLHDEPGKFALTVDRVGWADSSFVFPDTTIGAKDGERIYLQASSGINNLLETSGTLSQWQENIAHNCISNSRLVFTISAGFAAPLLSLFGISGGGFHFIGNSSVGKSTSQYAAGSVWGGGGKDGYVQTWKSTATGLEYLSEYHNDNLLCLDEIGEANPKEIGQSVYMIANGRGKHRGQAGGGLRKQVTWTVLALSSGEKTLEEHMAEAEQKIKKGQEVRLIDLPADAGAGLGAFEDLHGFDNGKDFSDHLRSASQSYYGTPIRAFLDRLINQRLGVTTRQRFEAYKKQFIAENLKNKSDNVAGRAADRFAVVGFAGVLASEWGITGWPVDEATKAAARLFQDWIVFRGQRDGGEDAGVARVIDFIQRHGSSRFQFIDDDNKPINDDRIINRAGFKKRNQTGEVIEYAISSKLFKDEVCTGLDYQDVARRLHAKGLLKKGDGANLAARYPVKGIPRDRYYVIVISPDDDLEVGQVGHSDNTG
jgi:putative DNA primase/helicase